MAQASHIGIDAQTLHIQAICVTSNEASEATVIADLLEQFPPKEALLIPTAVRLLLSGMDVLTDSLHASTVEKI